MMKKASSRRPAIPKKVLSKVLLANRHACCVCQKFAIHTHHIDSNPSNNDPENIAVLCMEHHNFATMQIALTRKLEADAVRKYKKEWEARCKADILALSRDRLCYYVTLYKNPPRIRELFIKLTENQRDKAMEIIAQDILDEDANKKLDQGFKWHHLPRKDDLTLACLSSMRNGQLWPEWLPRVKGHPQDADLPIDMSPPNGMNAFHIFDMYCQILVRALVATSGSSPIEDILKTNDAHIINSFSGCLVTFRDVCYGKNISYPRLHKAKHILGQVQLRLKNRSVVHKVIMSIKNMYVFSDTASENLRRSRICGIGLLVGAYKKSSKEIQIEIKPLLIGMGGFSGLNPDGWWKKSSVT